MKRLLITLPAALALCAVGEVYSYTFLRRGSPVLDRLMKKRTHSEEYYNYRTSTAEALRHQPQEVLTVKSVRGANLRGFYLPCEGSSGKKLAFIVHGYRSEHAETAGMYLDMYHRRGYDVFCPDHIASGESEGRVIGYDSIEAADCLRWIALLLDRNGADCEIILHGFSMGGATVMKMSAYCPENVRFIIEDSGYTSAERLIRPRLGASYGLFRALNRLVGGYDVRDTDVMPQLALGRKPMLFVHGREDPTVPFSEGERAFAAYTGDKLALFTDDSRHIETYYRHADRYEAAIDGFIGKYCTR